jgi:argininosuccinate lyase
VLNGVPFREAHALVAGLVQEALTTGTELSELVAAHELLGDEPKKLFENETIANIKKTHGAGSLKQLNEQITAFEQSIANNRSLL